jgi:hypothetical protein
LYDVPHDAIVDDVVSVNQYVAEGHDARSFGQAGGNCRGNLS